MRRFFFLERLGNKRQHLTLGWDAPKKGHGTAVYNLSLVFSLASTVYSLYTPAESILLSSISLFPFKDQGFSWLNIQQPYCCIWYDLRADQLLAAADKAGLLVAKWLLQILTHEKHGSYFESLWEKSSWHRLIWRRYTEIKVLHFMFRKRLEVEASRQFWMTAATAATATSSGNTPSRPIDFRDRTCVGFKDQHSIVLFDEHFLKSCSLGQDHNF